MVWDLPAVNQCRCRCFLSEGHRSLIATKSSAWPTFSFKDQSERPGYPIIHPDVHLPPSAYHAARAAGVRLQSLLCWEACPAEGHCSPSSLLLQTTVPGDEVTIAPSTTANNHCETCTSRREPDARTRHGTCQKGVQPANPEQDGHGLSSTRGGI
ncbi:hypothetical protein VTG60DRAFT_1156 [Thermothelomyces hinnuleus]